MKTCCLCCRCRWRRSSRSCHHQRRSPWKISTINWLQRFDRGEIPCACLPRQRTLGASNPVDCAQTYRDKIPVLLMDKAWASNRIKRVIGNMPVLAGGNTGSCGSAYVMFDVEVKLAGCWTLDDRTFSRGNHARCDRSRL